MRLVAVSYARASEVYTCGGVVYLAPAGADPSNAVAVSRDELPPYAPAGYRAPICFEVAAALYEWTGRRPVAYYVREGAAV